MNRRLLQPALVSLDARVVRTTLAILVCLARPALGIERQQIECVHVLDWDADGLLDLIALQPTADPTSALVIFEKNIGTKALPSFNPAIPLTLKGTVLTVDRSQAGLLVADYDGDRDFDLITISPTSIRLLDNEGPKESGRSLTGATLVSRLETSDWRKELTEGNRHFSVICSRLVDWDSDGDLDLLVAFYGRNDIHDPTRPGETVGSDLMFLEIFERVPGEGSAYKQPTVVNESRGLPINAVAAREGGVECVDWDWDGDLDLLYFDRHEETGRLMFAENDGSSQSPLFLKGIPILSVSGRPALVDWSGDGRFDLVAGREFFVNTNLRSGEPNPKVTARRASGTRQPRPGTFPRLVRIDAVHRDGR